MDWIHVTQDIDKFLRSFENGDKNSSTINGGEIFWLAEELLAFHEGLWFMELVIGDELQSLTMKFHSCIEYCDIPCLSMSKINFRALLTFWSRNYFFF